MSDTVPITRCKGWRIIGLPGQARGCVTWANVAAGSMLSLNSMLVSEDLPLSWLNSSLILSCHTRAPSCRKCSGVPTECYTSVLSNTTDHQTTRKRQISLCQHSNCGLYPTLSSPTQLSCQSTHAHEAQHGSSTHSTAAVNLHCHRCCSCLLDRQPNCCC